MQTFLGRIWFLMMFLVACQTAPPEAIPTLAVLEQAPQMLAFWQTHQGTLANRTEVDQWVFDGLAGDAIRLRLVQQGDSPLEMRLIAPNGDLLSTDTTIELRLPFEGRYTVRVRLASDGQGIYQLGLGYTDRPSVVVTDTPRPQVVGIPTPTPFYANLGKFSQQFMGNQRLGDTLSEDVPAQVYVYIGGADDIITVELRRISGNLDPFLAVYNVLGEVLAMDDNSGGNRAARLWNLRLPANGLYSIQVSGRGTYGDYLLTLTEGEVGFSPEVMLSPTQVIPTPYVTPTMALVENTYRLQDHIPVQGMIARSSDFARFTFSAIEGEIITVSALPVADLRLVPMIEVIDPDGLVVATARASASPDRAAMVTGLPIALSGTYSVILTSERDTMGSYQVAYGRGTSHTDTYQGELPLEQRMAGEITQRGIRHEWRVALEAGSAVMLGANVTLGGLDPVLELLMPDGQIISDDNGGGGRDALLRFVPIESDSVYILRVRDARSDQIGAYSVIWRYIQAPAMPTPIPQLVTLLSVTDEVGLEDYRFYSFQGRMNQRVWIEVVAQRGETLDAVAALIAPDGATIAEGDDHDGSLNPRFSVVLPMDGTYRVRVNGYLSAGAFDVMVKQVIE